jgi:ribosomal protein S12 methylthiotransferase
VREAQALEAQGVKELNLISQDSTWYGKDRIRAGRGRRGGGSESGWVSRDPGPPLPPAGSPLGGDVADRLRSSVTAPARALPRPGLPFAEPNTVTGLLPDLLRALLDETCIPWFRLFYMYPSGITREMVELLATRPRLLPYLDIPLQHGSDRILKAMRRPERRVTIRERVAWLREAVPGLTLRTTVIVGFPGETEADFRELLELLEELRFDRVGAFTYSLEEGTPAALMAGQVPADEKADRLEALMELQRGISFELNQAQVGTRTEALVDRVVDEDPEFAYQARTRSQALEVDGVTYLYPSEGVSPGDLVEIEIVDALDYDLLGKARRRP